MARPSKPSLSSHPLEPEGLSRLASWALYAWQWAVLLLICPPLLVLDVVASLPLATALWITASLKLGRRLAAQRDPALAAALHVDNTNTHWAVAAGAAWARCYLSLVMLFFHSIMRLFVVLGRPQVLFVVYTPNLHTLKKFFCVGTAELLYRARITSTMNPEEPWVFLVGLIHSGHDTGFGVYGALCPPLSHVTQSHLEQLPSMLRSSFPTCKAIALAGRLPGIMTAAGVPIKAPIVDGLSGTVFAMEATIRALVANLPAERRASPSVAILGGGGYIGSRLTSVLASSGPGKDKQAQAQPRAAAQQQQQGVDVQVLLKDGPKPQFRQIIALDTRYAGNRHAKAGVLYTAEHADLSAADVVLVITRNGDDVAEYVQHSRPGQQWGDDTHPEIGHVLLKQLAARGVHVHKAMATRSPPTALLPPLPGWPVAGTPGCLLMALVSAATGRDWNGAGTGLCSGGKAAESDRYWAFSSATKGLGFHAMLTSHKRSRVDGETKGL